MEQRLARFNRLHAPVDGQDLAIQQVTPNVVILNQIVKEVKVTRREFEVAQPLRFHHWN
jgi:hypothetical protein